MRLDADVAEFGALVPFVEPEHTEATAHIEKSLLCHLTLRGTFHDLKAKGISDYESSSRDKQLFSGHKTESQVLVYERKLTVLPT